MAENEEKMPKRILFLMMTTILCEVGATAHAAEAVLSLMGDSVVAETPVSQSTSTTKEEKAEDKGIFSFLNFWQGQNKPELSQDPNANETILEKYQRLANGGDLNAQMSLGYMYLYGDSENEIKQDFKEAFKYYEMAAKQGDNVAINNLGSLYYSGIGVEQNILKATQMFAKASELGNSEAMVNLAFIDISSTGRSYNPQEAIDLFKKAVKLNNPTASFMLGYAYYKGFIVEKNNIEAFNLIKKAASAGYDDAMYILANMYLDGEGTTQNYGTGVKILEQAVKQGHMPSMMLLADILTVGKKYPQNLFKAYVLFNIVSVMGNTEAVKKRNVLESNMKIEDLLQAQTQAAQFVAQKSPLTQYINQTFGENIKQYIDRELNKKEK